MGQQFASFSGAHHFRIDHQSNTTIAAGAHYQILNVGEDLILRLRPLLNASHTRDRKTSPPDSECFPGTREDVIREITTWADKVDLVRSIRDRDRGMSTSSDGSTDSTCTFWTCEEVIALPVHDGSNRETPHIYWLHGFAGCGKSAVSLEVARIYARSGRLLASYFFFRGAGDRSTMRRFAATLASQLVVAVPATAPLIEAAVKAHPGLLTGDAPLSMQLDLLFLFPLRAVIQEGAHKEFLANGPFLVVIDGLDECEDKRGAEEFIDHILDFFQKHSDIPLRFFIASRVEQHIRACLETDGVIMGNLDSHSARRDIEKFLQASFQAMAKKDWVIRAYIQAHGSWPRKSDMEDLVAHIGGSFVLASTIFKYIMQPATEEDPRTPMERLPLALQMNGLDSLYAQTLARSQNLPHFRGIISTLALLVWPLPIAGIADLLGIETYEVIRVLLNLQAILHVPGMDEEGEVTLCHTSLLDFLTTESRSGPFLVSHSFHLHLSYYSFSSTFGTNGPAYDYGTVNFDDHWRIFAQSEACNVTDEIELLKAQQILRVNRLPHHAFLCSMLFYFNHLCRGPLLSDGFNLLNECAKHLALAVECSDPRTRAWLNHGWIYGSPSGVRTVHITEDTLKAVQRDLGRASTALYANFPEILEGYPDPTDNCSKEMIYDFETSGISGVAIFHALRWIVVRARLEWEETKITPRLPLELYIVNRSLTQLAFSFDRTSPLLAPQKFK